MDYHNTNDEDLMLAYKEGDHRAFDVLFSRQQKSVYNFLYRFLGQNENVEEAFQEVFIRVVKSAEAYSPSAKFSTWLYTIARNYCIDQSRKGRLRRTTSLNEGIGNTDGLTLEERLPDEKASPHLEVSARNLEQKLKMALEAINPDQREVFLMREKVGLPFDEIAKIVGTSVNTVKSRMRYALLALQQEFKKIGIEDLK